ncbi:TolC family protein [Cellulophaga lytica]|uniref:TolC family protein n=1 Tax=Cellulophaga lytica TaxID=979 RepID=UPI0026E3127C|nr:TolC family protein [Cellulophaga lytica]MDO6852518.1 TolC family protein [Cellulophaga lytica]
MKLKITIVLLLFVVGLTNAQQKKWSIEECINYALENNIDVEQLELQLQSAKLGESDALGDFLPNLNGSTNGSWSKGSGFDQTTNQRVSGTFFSLNAGVSSGVTLFNGLRNIHNFNKAKLNTIASQYRLDGIKDNIVLNVANAYLDVLAAKESLKVVELQAEISDQDYERTKALVEAGTVPKGDLLELEATIADYEQQKVNGENNVVLRRLFLAQLLQITDYQNFDIAESTYNVPPSEIYNYTAKEVYDKALTIRGNIKLAETNIDIAEKDVKIAKGALYPTLSASVGYNTSYSSFVKRITNASFTDQLSENDGIGYGMSLSVPVFNGFSVRNNIRRSKLNLEQTKLQAEQEKLALEANINQAYLDVRSFGKRYEAAQKTYDARKQAYDFAKERFDVGLMNAFDFSQSQSRLDNAAIDVVNAKYNYIFRIKILEIYYGIPVTLE